MDLKKLRSQCEKRNIPIISKATEEFLMKEIKKRKPMVCLEIGGAVGYSGIFMAGLIDKRGGKLYSFEISYPSYRESISNSVASQSYNLISYPYNFLLAPIPKLLTEKKVDFIFIDGRKSEYGSYLEKLESIIGDKTVIIIDDVIKYHHKLTSLYGYLDKKQIELFQPPKNSAKRSPRAGKNDTDNSSFVPQDKKRGKCKGNEVIPNHQNSRIYKIMKLDTDDGVMIIEKSEKR